MTFTEAAAQVLRLVGKPLHYKEITDVAIEKNLLSHVGKSPEVTMGARLAALVKKGEKDTPLVRIKPGVFALRDWDKATIEAGLADRTPALERISDEELGEEAPSRGEESESSPEPGEGEVEAGWDEEDAAAIGADEQRRAELAAQANVLFDSEEDDDEPILGALAEEIPEDDDEERREGRRRRRRRRRGGRSNEESRDDDLPTYTVSDVTDEAVEGAVEAETRADRERERDRDRERGRDRDRPQRERREGRREDEPAARELGDMIEELLRSYDKNRGPVAAQSLADAAQRRGWQGPEAQLSAGVLLAAAHVDVHRAVLECRRPRFRIVGSKIAPVEWLLDGELLRLERELQSLMGRYREASRRSLQRLLAELPQRALGELVLLLLERRGITHLERVRRQGVHSSELHLSGLLRGPQGSGVRTAFYLRRDGREIGRERVIELRGGLHHYGPAHAGWLITTGQVLSGAREEAGLAGAAPITLIDGATLAELCEKHAIGVAAVRAVLPIVDATFFDALRSAG